MAQINQNNRVLDYLFAKDMKYESLVARNPEPGEASFPALDKKEGDSMRQAYQDYLREFDNRKAGKIFHELKVDLTRHGFYDLSNPGCAGFKLLTTLATTRDEIRRAK